MIQSRMVRHAFALGLFSLLAVSVSRADSVTYDFSYSGGSLIASSASGLGSFTYTYAPGSTTGTLTAFSFTDTISTFLYGSGTFNYGLASVLSDTVDISKTTGLLTLLDISTAFVTGTNSSLGGADFSLNYVPNVSVDGTTGYRLFSDTTIGTGTVAPTPEPSSLLLVGTGLLGAAAAMRRKFLAS